MLSGLRGLFGWVRPLAARVRRAPAGAGGAPLPRSRRGGEGGQHAGLQDPQDPQGSRLAHGLTRAIDSRMEKTTMAKTKKGLEAMTKAQLIEAVQAARAEAVQAARAEAVRQAQQRAKLPSASTPAPEQSHPSLPAGAVISVVPEGGFIPDGIYFVSPAGTLCYKLPQKTFSQVLAFSTTEALAQVASWPADKLERALTWANARLADKGPDGKVYLILPVAKTKQVDSLSMYMRRLWAFKKAVQAAQATQASDVLFASPPDEAPAF